jgi:hypothetical protein
MLRSILFSSAVLCASACTPAAPTTSGAGGQAGDAGTGEHDGAVILDAALDAEVCERRCAADLQRVVDSCTGATVESCPATLGCENGSCQLPPCSAARAARSTLGCDFWALKTDMLATAGDNTAACFAAFIANTWSSPVKIGVSYQGQDLSSAALRIPKGQGVALAYEPYDPAEGLPPGEVAIAFLSQGPKAAGSIMPPCPAPPALDFDPSVTGTGRGRAFQITTDLPVVAYQMLPFGGGQSAATSATLLLPSEAWGDNYLAINAYRRSDLVADGVPTLAILARDDDTTVTLLPVAPVNSGIDVSGGPAGAPLSYTLQAGEYLQITQGNELSGSPIASTKPIAVFGGATCMNVPVDSMACDTAHQQLPPIRALGHEYAGVRHRGRKGQDEQSPWRLVGAVSGTTLSWEPSLPAGAPQTLSKGQVAEFWTNQPFVVKSQDADHPFYLSGYMTGGQAFDGEGDPEWVNVIPTDQYLDAYVFFADPTYSETSLVVVRKKAKDGTFRDVTLDCSGPIGGFTAVGELEYARVDLVTGDFQGVNGCSNGRRSIASTAPFAVTVWGWGTIPGVPGGGSLFTQYVSYAYPAGAGIAPINDVKVTIPH